MEKLELTIGQEYNVRLHPKQTTVKASYIGKNVGIHVFDNDNIYIFLDSDDITRIEEKISYGPWSSVPVNYVRKEDLNKSEENLKEIEILRNLGVKI